MESPFGYHVMIRHPLGEKINGATLLVAYKGARRAQPTITRSKAEAKKIAGELAKQLKALDRAKIAKKALAGRSAIVLAKNLDEAASLVNRYAPEHLVLAMDDADGFSKQILNAGCIFLGRYTPVAVGDYLAGPNHVLPTAGTARFSSALSVDHFMKKTSPGPDIQTLLVFRVT